MCHEDNSVIVSNLGDIPIDVPQPKYWRGCGPGGVDASAVQSGTDQS